MIVVISPTAVIPAGVLHNRQIMALGAQGVGSSHGQVGIGKEIVNRATLRCGRVEFISALQNVGPLGTMGTVRALTAEFAIVVAVVAIGAENLGARGATQGNAIQLQHVSQQAGLQQTAAADVQDGMAGDGRDRWRKLREHVKRIGRRNRTYREVTIDGQRLFAGAGAVAAQAVLILIDRGRKHAGSVAGVDAGDVFLRDANERRKRKYSDHLGPMSIVAVHAGGMTVVVEQRVLGGIVRIGRAGKWMPDLGRGVL